MSSFLAWRRSLSQENVLLAQASDEVSGIWENNVLLVPVTLEQTLPKILKAKRFQILQGILGCLNEKKCISKFLLLFFGS